MSVLQANKTEGFYKVPAFTAVPRDHDNPKQCVALTFGTKSTIEEFVATKLKKKIEGISQIYLTGVYVNTMSASGATDKLVKLNLRFENSEELENACNHNLSFDCKGTMLMLDQTEKLYFSPPLLIKEYKNYEGAFQNVSVALVGEDGVPKTWTKLILLLDVYTRLYQ